MQTYIDYSQTFFRIKHVNENLRESEIFNSAEKVGIDEYVFHFSSLEEKVKLFSTFRDFGIAFAIGKDWSPAEEFEYYREEGYLNGKFLKIMWNNQDEYEILEA